MPDKCENGMPCQCGGPTGVQDSRRVTQLGIRTVRRRRVCKRCAGRFTTYEIPDTKLHMLLRQPRMLVALRRVMQEIDTVLKEGDDQ